MKLIDQIYQCRIPGQVFGLWPLQCHLRIFQSHKDVQLVMVTDMGFEMGWFIPYLVEALITQIVSEFYLDPSQLIWIEHYTPGFRKPTCADFSQVMFNWQDGQAHNPQWSEMTSETLQMLVDEKLQPELAYVAC